jgi:hypothetical protein
VSHNESVVIQAGAARRGETRRTRLHPFERGQYLLVDRRHEIIIAKVPSQAFPVDLQRGLLTLRAVSRIVGFLAASSA